MDTEKHKVLSWFLGTEVLCKVNDFSVGDSVLKPKKLETSCQKSPQFFVYLDQGTTHFFFLFFNFFFTGSNLRSLDVEPV